MEAFSQLCTACSFEGAWPFGICRRMMFCDFLYQSPAGGPYDSRFIPTYLAVRRDCSVPACASPGDRFWLLHPVLLCFVWISWSSARSPRCSHLNVLRCPCGLLRLPTHGLDIIETSGRTPINRDKAKPRKKKESSSWNQWRKTGTPRHK
ncbi:hypothetical protein HDV63DRAFT_17800 [Trichoderma sp. SZMC 28014]